MAIIHKRADELQVGDVVSIYVPPMPTAPGQFPAAPTVERLMFIGAEKNPRSVSHEMTAFFIVLAEGRKPSQTERHFYAFHSLDVEVPEAEPLTPAQQHAEDMVEMLWVAANHLRTSAQPGNQDVEARARALLAEVRPEPPTLAEALEALYAITPLAFDDQMYDEDTARVKADAYKLLERARRAGILK